MQGDYKGVMRLPKGTHTSGAAVIKSPVYEHRKICFESCRTHEHCMEAMNDEMLVAELRSKQQALTAKERGAALDQAIQSGVILEGGKRLIGHFRVGHRYFVCARAWAYVNDWSYSTLNKKLNVYERALVGPDKDMLEEADNGVSTVL